MHTEIGPLRRLLLRGLVAAAVLATATAHAEPRDEPRNEPRNDELWIGGGARALRSSSANALTHRNLGGTSFGYARAVGIAAVPGVALWAELGATIDAASGTLFQTLSTDISALGLTGGMRARYRVHRLVAASARLDVGGQRARITLGDRGGPASDRGWGAMASAAAALELYAVAQRSFGLGMRVEVGYVAAQAITLTPERERPGDVLELAMTELALGGLDLSGPTLAASLVAQF